MAEITGPSVNGMSKARAGIQRVPVRPETALFAVYAIVACFMTYPAITMVSRTYAERRDPLGTIWWLWWYRYSFTHHLPLSPMKMAAVPWGIKSNVFGIDPLYGATTRAMSIILGETITYNIFLLVSFFLAAITMYFLVRRLTGSRPAAAFAGLAFGFCPYMLAQGKEHLSLTATFWLPLFALFLFRAYRNRTGWSIAGCGLVLAFLSLFSYQYGMLAVFFGVTFLLTVWLAGAPWNRRSIDRGVLVKAAAVVLVVAVVAGVLLVALTRSTSGEKKPLEALYQYSARPWDYIIPTAESSAFGGITRGFITSHLHGGFLVENSLFLGYTTLLLTAFALVYSYRRRRRLPIASSPAGEEITLGEDASEHSYRGLDCPDTGRIAFAFAVCAVVAFMFSMPPTATLFGLKLYFPSRLMYKLIPQFRAYARFGLIVMMCAAVLAGYGIAFLFEWLGPGRKRPAQAMAFVLMVLVVLEFTIVPPFYSLDTEVATGYSRWLKSRAGKQSAAIYPLYVKDDFQNYDYFFQQRLHQKKLVNGADPDSEGELYRQSILDLYHPATPGLLKKLGARFVVVIPSQMASPSPPHLNYTFPTRFDPSRLPPGLKEVARPTDSIVYEITAPPAEFVPLFGAGSYQAYIDPDGRFWHPVTNGVVVDIQSSLDQPALCDIKLTAMSARALSRLTFEVNGKTLSQHEVPPWPTDVVLTDVVLSSGANTLVIKSDGRTANLTEVPYYSDVSAAMMLGNILVEKKP